MTHVITQVREFTAGAIYNSAYSYDARIIQFYLILQLIIEIFLFQKFKKIYLNFYDLISPFYFKNIPRFKVIQCKYHSKRQRFIYEM